MSKDNPFIQSFSLLGRFLGQFPENNRVDSGDLGPVNKAHYEYFSEIIEEEPVQNPWFTPGWLNSALSGISSMLDAAVLEKWLTSYGNIPVKAEQARNIGLVLAGNIPLVGFHDILCVLAAGHRVQAKASSKDDRLIKGLVKILGHIDPGLGSRISLTEQQLKGMDAIIATGSNNSARYFEYYFSKYPHIIRKNRNGVAVLTGNESPQELHALGEDIFTYFGMGCRNVTKLYVPENYDLKVLLGVLDGFAELSQHNKYANNVDYHRSLYLLNQLEFLDNGVTLLKEDKGIASPAGVVFYERYSDLRVVQQLLREREEEIQCTVSVHPDIAHRVRPGESQLPMPWDYADGVDTITFLTQLP